MVIYYRKKTGEDMNKDQLDSLLNDLFVTVKNTLHKKSKDYASEGDILSCFKKVAEINNSDSKNVLMNQISIKVVRLGELLSANKAVNNESIQDTIIDLIGYSVLIYGLLNNKNLPKDGIVTGKATRDLEKWELVTYSDTLPGGLDSISLTGINNITI